MGILLFWKKTDTESLLMSMGNITGVLKGAQDGNVTTSTSMMQNILIYPQVTSGGFLFVKAKYN